VIVTVIGEGGSAARWAIGLAIRVICWKFHIFSDFLRKAVQQFYGKTQSSPSGSHWVRLYRRIFLQRPYR